MTVDDFNDTLKKMHQGDKNFNAYVPVDELNELAGLMTRLTTNEDFRKFATLGTVPDIENIQLYVVEQAKSGKYDNLSDSEYQDIISEATLLNSIWWRNKQDVTLDLKSTYKALMSNLRDACDNIEQILEYFDVNAVYEYFT